MYPHEYARGIHVKVKNKVPMYCSREQTVRL